MNFGSGTTGCVAAVRAKCAGLKNRSTETWKRGTYVKTNCASIPSGTAIATFFGPGTTYKDGKFKHAAILIGCNAEGIQVHDQWVGKSGCGPRTIRYSGTDSDGGNNFWTID